MKFVLSSIMVLGANPLFGIVIQDYLKDSGHRRAGTDPRNEYEFKLAFDVDGLVAQPTISKIITEAILHLGEKDSLAVPKLLGRSYSLDKSFQSFAFKDVYLDSPELKVLALNSAYRLRHRWSRRSLYSRYLVLPFLKVYYPNRCEVQFKYNYQGGAEENTLSVQESRFEFRNASHPFSEKNDAPAAPWPEDEYLAYASSGRYKEYRMAPSHELMKVLAEQEIDHVDLAPVVRVVTSRLRSHLNLSDNPWGQGPNPDQVFILTVDVSEYSGVGRYEGRSGKFIEIEIEIDRNTSVAVEEVSNSYDEFDEHIIKERAAQFSSSMRKSLRYDLSMIKESISESISNAMGKLPLKTDYKYARIMKRLQNTQRTNI